MPMYDIGCDICERKDTVFRTVAQYDDLPECCGVKMHRLLSAPAVMGDIQPYQSMVTGEYIMSRSHHKAHLKQHGMIEIGNETKYLESKPKSPPPDLKKTLIEVANSKL